MPSPRSALLAVAVTAAAVVLAACRPAAPADPDAPYRDAEAEAEQARRATEPADDPASDEADPDNPGSAS